MPNLTIYAYYNSSLILYKYKHMGCGSGLICIKNTQVALPVTHTETKANRGVGSKDGNPTSINETYGQNGQNGNGRKLVSINIKEVPNIRSSLYLDAKAKHNAQAQNLQACREPIDKSSNNQVDSKNYKSKGNSAINHYSVHNSKRMDEIKTKKQGDKLEFSIIIHKTDSVVVSKCQPIHKSTPHTKHHMHTNAIVDEHNRLKLPLTNSKTIDNIQNKQKGQQQSQCQRLDVSQLIRQELIQCLQQQFNSISQNSAHQAKQPQDEVQQHPEQGTTNACIEQKQVFYSINTIQQSKVNVNVNLDVNAEISVNANGDANLNANQMASKHNRTEQQ